MHEQQLPSALAADRDGHFVSLVQIYQDRLYGFTLRLTGNPQDAEEIVVEALSRAYEALGRYAPERRQALALRPWLYHRDRALARGSHAVCTAVEETSPGLQPILFPLNYEHTSCILLRQTTHSLELKTR